MDYVEAAAGSGWKCGQQSELDLERCGCVASSSPAMDIVKRNLCEASLF